MCLLFAALFSLPVVAQNITKNISATYRNIKIFINSKEQATDLEPFIYNNSTYVPLRFVSEKMNASVDWDDKTNTISIATENAADSNALKAIEKAKEFTGSAFDVYRATEAIYINNVLFYVVEVSFSGEDPRDFIYYNTSDTRLYNYKNGELTIFQ
jgi:hypothetical protein